jgi:hypothetical protein
MAGQDEKGSTAVVFWPWGRRTAVAATGLLLVVLVGAVAVLRIAADWPDARWEAAFVLAAVLLSLLPIALLVLESVAQSQGSVSFRGVSVDFGAVAQAAAAEVTRSTIAIPRNVAEEGVDVGDSGHSEVLSVLREASRAEVVVVDLEDGHAWWDSRLLLLCAGAERQGRPTAVVFVATIDGVRRRFVGWADPADVVARILEADPELHYAYMVARASASRAELTFPGRAAPGAYPSVTPALDAAPKPQHVVSDHELFERRAELQLPLAPAMALVKALGRTVHPLEEAGSVRHLSVVGLVELLAPVLHTRHTEESAPDDRWVSAVAALDLDYLVVTASGVYRGMAPRERLTRALLHAVVSALAAEPGAAVAPPAPAVRPETETAKGEPAAPDVAAGLPLIPGARSDNRQPAS